MGSHRRDSLLRTAVSSGRTALLRVAAALGDATRVRASRPVLRAAWASGVSVVIPERGTPLLLERALDHLRLALAGIAEPWEIVVVVNGEPEDRYANLRARFADVRWQFCRAPLGFVGALERGLSAVRFGGIYLHNSDMALEADALTVLLPWRAPQVFAIASQILFDDPDRRREETGWGDLRLPSGRAELFDRTPEADGLVRAGLYAGGGSSLYDAALLKRFAANTRSYAPFYWEDADWGLQAWRNGLEVLFHPGSVAWHRHRATISRYYAADEVERIVARNRLLFELRNFKQTLPALRDAQQADPTTTLELSRWSSLVEIGRARRAARRSAPFPDIDLERITRRYYGRPPALDGRPLVLVVSPYCILPPLHGGAWRTWRLCEALSDRWRFILLSDEESAHQLLCPKDIGPFESVHLVGPRPDGPTDRIGRIRSHSHDRLQAELNRIVAVHRPDLVQVEHIELSGLHRPTSIPSVIVAHDVLLSADSQSEADAFERQRLATFDAVIACSQEDVALLAPLPAWLVPNGAVVTNPCRPSRGNYNLLFAGPFRYAPNLQGIRTFLMSVFPELRRRFSAVSLTILAGMGGRAIAAADPIFDEPGVTVEDAVVDIRPWLETCALTINPLLGTRGSSIKVIESVAAGRVCVSSRDGARGWIAAGLSGLVLADDIAGMLEPITQMLVDEPSRLRLEKVCVASLSHFSWRKAALRQEGVYRTLLGSGRPSP